MNFPNDLVRVRIESLAAGGDGVGRVDGFPLFIPEAAPGDLVQARVTERKKSFGRGVIVDLLEPAPGRVDPLCPYFGVCGGCQWQHLAYGEQLRTKAQVVEDALTRLGGLREVEVRETIPSPQPWGYRNKADWAVVPEEKGGFRLGYHARDPREVVDIASCPLLHPFLNDLLRAVRDLLTEFHYPAYDPRTGQGLIRAVGARVAANTSGATVLLTTGRRDLPEKRRFYQALRERLPQVVGLSHYARTRASQSASGRPVGMILGHPLTERIGDLSFQISPASFFQVNTGLIPTLWTLLDEALRPRGEECVVDVYSGVGTLALWLGKRVQQVWALEEDRSAAHDAEVNVRQGDAANVAVRRGPAEATLPALIAEGLRPDAIVLDPPRRGCDPRVLRAGLAVHPPRIVYFSCDPATLARDLKELTAGGYALPFVQPVDLFPQTSHVEVVAGLKRKGN